jgi:hypothetical protein
VRPPFQVPCGARDQSTDRCRISDKPLGANRIFRSYRIYVASCPCFAAFAEAVAKGWPRGPDRPDLRRAQALVCSGAVPKVADAIACEILRSKLIGQAEVAGLLGFADESAAIRGLTERIARDIDGKRALSTEAEAAWIYWNLWEQMPVRFARRNPQRLGSNGKWRPGRADLWLTFGSRTSLLSRKPSRATTPGNCLINYLYAILESEMIVAQHALGLDPGIGMFHADIEVNDRLRSITNSSE